MLKNKCYLKDIRDFEENMNVNIIPLLNTINMRDMCLLLSIVYRDLSIEQVADLIDKELENGISILELSTKITSIILGYDISEDIGKEVNEDENKNEYNALEDITNYKSLNEFHMHCCMELMSLGMSYNEFWSMTTREMYQAYKAIQQKFVLDYNKQMQFAHTQAALIGGAVWGKLDKKAPHLNIEDLLDPNEEIDTPHGRMTREDYRIMKELGEFD